MNKLKQLIVLGLMLVGFYANGQDVDFNLRFNGTTNEYEVYARPTFTGNYFIGGGTQISILFNQGDVQDAIIGQGGTGTSLTSWVGGNWADNSQIYGHSSGFDYHAFATNGGQVSFTAGTEIILFTFSLQEGCQAGARLFENATDPGPTDPGMNGGDFLNFFADVTNPWINDWNSNYVNSGLICPDAPIVIFNPITIPAGGTSTQDYPILDLNPLDTWTATLCTGSPAGGSANVSVTGDLLTVDYSAGAFVGEEELCVIVCDDPSLLCDTLSIPVTVLPAIQACGVPTPPGLVITPITTVQDDEVTVCSTILDHNHTAGDVYTESFCNTLANGSATSTINGTELCITYTPNPGWTGTESLCVDVCDPSNLCGTVNIPISVVPTPTSAADSQEPTLIMPPLVTDEDITHTVCGAIIDVNVSEAHTVTICGAPTDGAATAVVDNALNSVCLTYDPDPNFFGRDNVCLEICDDNADCYQLDVPIVVVPVNDAPLAIFDINSTQMNVPVDGIVITNDSDVEGNNLTVNTTPVSESFGTVTALDAAGTYTFTPDVDFTGNASFEYEICDDGCPVECSIALVIIEVTDNTDPENNSIVATDDNFTMELGFTLNASIISNDYDPDGDNISVNTTPITNPTNGTVTINPDGTIAYSPVGTGTDSFQYEICDDGTPQECETATVTITTVEDNDTNDLFASDDANAGEVNQNQTGNVVLNDYDPEGDALTVNTTPILNTFDPVTEGVVTLLASGAYTFQPATDFIGNGFFIYEVCDDGSPVACDQATVYITVLDSKDAPVVITNPLTVDMDETGNICMPVFDVNATDTHSVTTSCAGDPANAAFTTAANGSATTQIDGNGDLCVNYTPDTGYIGYDEVCVIVCDQTGRCDTAYVPITIVPIALTETNPDRPDAIITPVTVLENDDATVCSTILDGNSGDSWTTVSCGGAANGTATLTPSGNGYCIDYTPNANFVGSDDICIDVCDGPNCDQIIVPITVVPTPVVPGVDQTPILVMPPVVTYEDINVTTCGNIIDVNVPDTHTATICGQPVNGTVTLAPVDNANDALCLTFDPLPNFIGSDEVCITICDQGSLCYDLTVPIEVIPVNDPPLAIDDINNTQVNIPVSGNVLTNDSDPEDDNLTVNTTVTNIVGASAVVIQPNGAYQFTPTPGFVGNGSFEYQVCDDGNPIECDNAVVTIAVVDVTDPDNNGVIGLPDHYVTEDDAPLNGSVLDNDSDPDPGHTYTVTATTNPASGTLTGNADGTFVYTPVPGVYGDQTFTYTICDDGTPQACEIVPVTITVLEGNTVNDIYAVDDAYLAHEDETITGNVATNDNDPENGTMTVTILTPPAAGTGTVNLLNTTGDFEFIPDPDFTGNAEFIYEVCDNGSPIACDTATAYIAVLNVSTELRLKVMLLGALYETGPASDNMMRTDLYDAGLIPLTQPYNPNLNPQTTSTRFTHVIGGNETTTQAVLDATAGTDDAIVDWVFVELRDGANSSNVIRTISALLQRDGDIVNAEDGGVIYVDSLPSTFFASVKHRNHLGVMTQDPLAEVANVATFDFTTATSAQLFNHPATALIDYDGLEQKTFAGQQAMWAGNCNIDDKVKYDGAGSDQGKIQTELLAHPGNGTGPNDGSLNYNNAIGYYLGDVNLDGKVKYDGSINDRGMLHKTIIEHSENPLGNPTGVPLNNFDFLIEQIPN